MHRKLRVELLQLHRDVLHQRRLAALLARQSAGCHHRRVALRTRHDALHEGIVDGLEHAHERDEARGRGRAVGRNGRCVEQRADGLLVLGQEGRVRARGRFHALGQLAGRVVGDAQLERLDRRLCGGVVGEQPRTRLPRLPEAGHLDGAREGQHLEGACEALRRRHDLGIVGRRTEGERQRRTGAGGANAPRTLGGGHGCACGTQDVGESTGFALDVRRHLVVGLAYLALRIREHAVPVHDALDGLEGVGEIGAAREAERPLLVVRTAVGLDALECVVEQRNDGNAGFAARDTTLLPCAVHTTREVHTVEKPLGHHDQRHLHVAALAVADAGGEDVGDRLLEILEDRLECFTGFVHERGHADLGAAVVEPSLLERLADVAREAPRTVACDEELGCRCFGVHGGDPTRRRLRPTVRPGVRSPA